MIDYQKVFTRIPDIVGFPDIRFIRGKWYAHRRLDGSEHQRWDKFVCRFVNNGIQVLEAGGEAMSLYNWLLKYTPYDTPQKVMDILCGNGVASPLYYEHIQDEPETQYIPDGIVIFSENNRIYEYDFLSLYFHHLFGREEAERTIRRYRVGAYQGRRTIFWFISSDGLVYHDKIMLYLPNGSRSREKSGAPMRFYRKSAGYNGSCFFGSHLLREDKKVYVVESEKTAIMLSCLLRDGVTVLATGGKNTISRATINPGWILIPDVDAYSLWSKTGQAIKWWELLEYSANDKDDIADYIKYGISRGNTTSEMRAMVQERLP